jgi:hypothetical protein
MKLTTKILAGMLIILIAGLFISNISIRHEFQKRQDQEDVYWNYDNILEQPFSHLVIHGGKLTWLSYEPSAQPSVRVYKNWDGYERGLVKARVSGDTLYLYVSDSIPDRNERDWLARNTTVRLFSPVIHSISGFDTRIEFFKMKPTSLYIDMSGKSKFEIESLVPRFDSIRVRERDSSEVVFELSPEIGGSRSFAIPYLEADLQDQTFLDVGRAQIDSLRLIVADSSGVLLSGGTIRKKGLAPVLSGKQ